MLAQNSYFMQMKIIYFHIFTQTIVNFGKSFTSFETCISIPLSYLYFSFLLQIILHSAKEEKRKTLDLGAKSRFESGLVYVIALWVRTSYFVPVRLCFLSCKMG